VLFEALAAGVKPDPRLLVSEWAGRFRYLPPEASAEPGLWRNSRAPYLAEIMDCLSPGNPVQEVVLMKGTQLGGTEVGNNWIGYVIDQAPGPMMFVRPTSNSAKKESKTRLAPTIEASPALRNKVKDARSRDSGNTTLMKEFAGGVLILAGANSAAELKSSPVRYLFLDELDEYPADVDGQGDPEELAEKRTDTFSRKKIYKVSTPTIAGHSRIERAFERSDQRYYLVPCPHCAAEQRLLWEQMRWETRKRFTVTRADDGEVVEVPPETDGAKEDDTGELIDVWYECSACHERIEEHQKTVMLEAGRWQAMNPGGGRAAGFHLSALYSPLGWFSWWTAVRKWLEAAKDTTGTLFKVFANTVQGVAYHDKGEQVGENELRSHVGEYRLQQVPKGALLLVAGTDVQHNRLETRVWGFGRDRECWLVDRQIVHGSPLFEETWAGVEDILAKGYAHESGSTLRITAMAIDASDGNTTHYVRSFCRKWAHTRRVIAIKGQAQQGKSIIGKPTDQDVSHRGVVIKRGVKLWPYGSDTAKALAYALYRVEDPGPGYVHLPQGLPDDEFKQMTAERVVTRYVKGFAKREWTKRPGDPNEALDCFGMALAAAVYAGVDRINWDALEQQVAPAQRDIFAPQQNVPRETVTEAPNRDDAAPAAADAAPGAEASVPGADAVSRKQTHILPPKRGGFVGRWRA